MEDIDRTLVSSDWPQALDGFERIVAGQATPELRGGVQLYRFQGFAVALPRTTTEARGETAG